VDAQTEGCISGLPKEPEYKFPSDLEFNSETGACSKSQKSLRGGGKVGFLDLKEKVSGNRLKKSFNFSVDFTTNVQSNLLGFKKEGWGGGVVVNVRKTIQRYRILEDLTEKEGSRITLKSKRTATRRREGEISSIPLADKSARWKFGKQAKIVWWKRASCKSTIGGGEG